MRLTALSFLIGTVVIQLFQQLPPITWLIVPLTASLFLTTRFKNNSGTRTIVLTMTGFVAGLLVATVTADKLLDKRLVIENEGQEIIITGDVLDLPEYRLDGTRFRFKVKRAVNLNQPDIPLAFNGIVRLGWYQDRQNIRAGESWQLLVRMKRPNGFFNPGGFDYEKWLFTERISATGYVRKSDNLNKRTSKAPWWSVNQLRQNIHESIQEKVADAPTAAVLSALIVAVRTELNDVQWQQLQRTGTNHLIAISGLHIAIVAGFAFFPMMLIWRLFPTLNEKIPLKVAGGIVGVFFAISYAMLAGFTLPTQRALIMVVVSLYGLLSRRNYSASMILAIAMLAVLLIDPLAAMTISFWLSFTAVALILVFLKRQFKKPALGLVRLQIMLSLLMLPLTLLFFGSASLVSPVANLIAIPWVSFVVIPISLLALISIPIFSFISDSLFALAGETIGILFKGLSFLAESPLGHISPAEIPVALLILAFAGLLFLFFPKGFPGRWLGLVFLLPALLSTAKKPEPGGFTFSFLDVGQGMASVLHTAKHSLIYDTGTHVSDSFDIGKLVVVPYLKSKGLDKVDTMIISHEDIDHRGGAKYISKHISIDKILSSDSSVLQNSVVEPCIKGTKWNWDGVDFEILSPPVNYPENDNNRSCVLRVSNTHHTLLLTADIQIKTEALLLESQAGKLDSDVMSVPHHGSKTSSSLEFIQAVSPQLALITAGYRSRFGHPKPDVVKRYKDSGIKVMDTVTHGAIEVVFPATNENIKSYSYRDDNRGFWNR